MMEPTLEITSVAGEPMLVRFVKLGARYGLEGCLTHPNYSTCQETPLVEFYFRGHVLKHGDLAWEGREGCWFVSRYYLDTFLGTSEYSRGGGPVKTGLCLDGGMRGYDLSAETCQKVAAWIESLDQGEGNEAV